MTKLSRVENESLDFECEAETDDSISNREITVKTLYKKNILQVPGGVNIGTCI